MLCDACTALFAGRAQKVTPHKEDRLYKMHHPNLESFRIAKDFGCGVCCKSWPKFCTDDHGQELSREMLVTATAICVPYSPLKSINIVQFNSWVLADRQNSRSYTVLTMERISEGEWLQVEGDWYLQEQHIGFEMVLGGMADSRSTNDFGASSGSTQSYSLAKNWLRSCLDDHRPSTDDTQNFFPDRVLDLGRRGDTTVKLYLSPSTDGGQGRRERYATLSYCWGAANHLKLEGAVLQSFQAGINTSELPRTMRHAVGLVRELGLRFLWIDSLCIIQDSIDDWRTQSALMGSIYQHSHINIAASTSEDSEGGLFFSRVPQTVRPVQVTCHFPFGRPNILSRLLHRRNAQPRLYNVLQQKPYFESIEQATLNSRGWVMQERLLAPRTLHCTRNQLFWECEHMLANESHPDGIETTLNRQPGEFRRMLTQFSHDPTSKVDNGIQRAADVAWFSLVKEYSICNLTKEEDILIAISGLAKRWIQIIPDRYIAGFWKQSLQEGLLWHGEQMIPALVGGEPCSTWRAPSWSWASFKGAVTWSSNVIPHEKLPNSVNAQARLAKFVGVDLAYESADVTGQLRAGSLTIQAALIQTPQREGFRLPPEYRNREDEFDTVWANGPGARSVAIHTKDRQYNGICYIDSTVVRRALEEEESPVVTCLPVLLSFTRSRSSNTQIDLELEGLLVERVDSDRIPEEIYQRIGYFSVRSAFGGVAASYRFFQELQGHTSENFVSRLGFDPPARTVLV